MNYVNLLISRLFRGRLGTPLALNSVPECGSDMRRVEEVFRGAKVDLKMEINISSVADHETVRGDNTALVIEGSIST